MKSLIKLSLLSVILTFAMNICYSQDIIVVDNGTEIKAKIVQVTTDLVKYKTWENQSGNTMTVLKKYIFMIKYADGTKDFINFANSTPVMKPASTDSTAPPVAVVNKSKYSGPIKIAEPEFDNTVVFANDSIGNGIILEKQESNERDPNEVQNTFNPYSSKVGSEAYVKNATSDVRINQRTNLSFLLPYQERVNPIEYIKIFKLKKGKKTRNLKQYDMNVHVFGDATEKNLDKDLIKYTYKKYGERSYLITIEKLEAGEYAITVNSNRSGTFYLFGVD